MWTISLRTAVRGRIRALVKRVNRTATGSRASTGRPYIPRPVIEYGAALASVALTTLIIGWVQAVLHASNLSIVYLIAVLWLAATFGRWPAVAAAVLAFLAYDFFFVPPLHGFTVDAPAEWVSLSALLATALVLGQLTSMVQVGARAARRSERRTATLYALSQLLASTTDPDTLPAALVQRVLAVFGPAGVSACVLIVRGPDGSPLLRASACAGGDNLPAELLLREPRDVAQASWVLDHGAPVGGPVAPDGSVAGTSERHIYLMPLVSGRTVAGVLGVAGTATVRDLAGGLRRRGGAGSGRAAAPGAAAEPANPMVGLFAAFCEQIALALDHLRLQREAIHAEALRESDRLKDAFLGSVTHDLRTPLAAITSATTTLLEADMQLGDDDRRAMLSTIGQSADRLNRLVGNLLDLSRLEAGVAAPRRDWYLIDDVIATVLDRFEVAHELSDRRIELRLSEDAPLVLMDHAQIEQVLTNLLENALKYSPPGTPIAIATLLRAVPRELEVTVRDEGIGIPPGEIGAIFDKFYRVTTVRLPWASSRPAAGTGLGLAICAGIVEAHGGRIWAESAPGGDGAGTTLHFTLPLSPDAPAGALPNVAGASARGRRAARQIGGAIVSEQGGVGGAAPLDPRAPGTPAAAPRGGHGARVLVIDDEPEIRRAVRTGLEGAAFEVAWAPTGREGLDLVARWHPDVVILDLALPDMDGIAVCRELREWSAVPIIVLSVRSGDADKITALELGADDYLTKPFSIGELLARIRVALRHAAARGNTTPGDAVFRSGELVVDFAARTVAVAGREVHLTPTEYEVLKYLAMHAGKVVTHRTLLRAVWGPQYEDEAHYLRVFIGQLRRKIEPDPSRPRYVVTEPGIGYRLRLAE